LGAGDGHGVMESFRERAAQGKGTILYQSGFHRASNPAYTGKGEASGAALWRRAAEQWYGWDDTAVPPQVETGEAVTMTTRAGRKAWARLPAKVYEIDIFCCPQCGGRIWEKSPPRSP